MARVVYYPAFADAATLNDRYWRAVHYLGPVSDHIESIALDVGGHQIGAPPIYLDQKLPARAVFVEQRLRHLRRTDLATADLVIVWDKSFIHDAALRDAKRVAVLDPTALHEGDLSIEVGASLAPQSKEKREIAHARLAAAVRAERREIVQVFGTGPSLEDSNFDTSEHGVSVVCNSVVRDVALMERLRPRFITAIDPIFHAGPSRHAAAFRAALVRALEMHSAWFVVQERDLHLYEALLPSHLHQRILPVPVCYDIVPNLDWLAKYSTTATRNVLTLTMLPLAAQLGDQIRIYGCDGRPVRERDTFWRYATNTAFPDELALQHEAHPGFFTLDHQDYYALHCETVLHWIRAIERRGVSVRAATPSYIPALANRLMPGVAASEAPPIGFKLRSCGAYLHRQTQAGYGAVLADARTPAWLKRGLRGVVQAVRGRAY